jgi:hypothetical protein
MTKVRSGFMGSFCAMVGPALAAGFMQCNFAPAAIWVAVWMLMMLVKPDER